MKKKTALMLIGILLAVPFIPIPTGVFRDGGTRTYSAMAYKLVIWNRLIENGIYHKTSVYWFPDSLKSIDELWIREYGKQDRDIFNRAAGKTYKWEKGGFPSDFSITLNPDGTYTYYEGVLSSYIGMGNWSVKNGIITLKESTGYDFVFHFYLHDGDLVFMAEDSSQFIYVKAEDGDRFIPAE